VDDHVATHKTVIDDEGLYAQYTAMSSGYPFANGENVQGLAW